MKGGDLVFALATGLLMLGAGYILGAGLTNDRWRRATGCRLAYRQIASTNGYEAVRLDKEER